MLNLERNVQRQNRLLVVTLFDAGTIAFACGAAMLTVMLYNLRSALPPIEQMVQLDQQEVAHASAALGTDAKSARHVAYASRFNLLERLFAAGTNANGVGQGRKELNLRWSTRLEELTKGDLAFWRSRSDELCQGAKVPRAPVLAASPAAPPVAFVSEFGDISRYRNEVWEQYDHCREESKVILDEDLLHFSFDQSELFDMTPNEVAHAEQEIRKYVDQHYELKMRKVHIYGHCDVRGKRNRNYPLSYGRAWHVARVVLDHLTSKGLTEGRDFMVIPVGMGASRPLPCIGEECDSDDYHRRCRRIELAFQKLTPADREASKKIGRVSTLAEAP